MYLTKKKNHQYKVIDIEADGLDPTQIWCCVTKDIDTGEIKTFYNKEEFNAWASPDFVYIGHNIISFDVPVINRLWGSGISLDDCVDSLILSYLYNPALEGGHSLEAYGERLKFPKGVFSDWSKFSPEMLQYCIQDVELTHRVYTALTRKMNHVGYSEQSCWIEHRIRGIIDEQSRTGFYFNRAGAIDLRFKLRSRQDDITTQIHKLFPPTRTFVKRCNFKRCKDGSLPVRIEKACSRYSDVVINEAENYYDCYDLEEFNLGSPKQRVKKLLEIGWVPDKFTKNKTEEFPQGFPKVDEDALVAFSNTCNRPEVAALAEWLVLQGRASMLDTWLNNLGSDSRIHGKILTCGAATRRMVHSKPNSANIPSGAKAKYGHECRALWGVEPDKGLIQVGVDASSLETIGLLHYLPSQCRTEAERILNQPKPNDIHSLNSRKLTDLLGRFIDREWGAKTSWYACVPLDTKILTRRGWKFYNEVIIGEEVLGYNQETKLKEWTHLRNITLREEEVFDIRNSRRSFRATGNHRWFVRQRRMGSKAWAKINGRYMEDQVRTTDELNTESSIIMNAPFNEAQDTVSQIQGLDGKYDVNWEQRVLKMSHKERVQFVQGFLLADGYISIKEPKTWRWTQNKGNVAEGLLLATYLIHDGQLHVGERQNPNHKMWTVTLSAKSHITGMKLEKISLGIQTVWCPTTDLGSWVMRQGEDITITGNCLYGAYPPKLAQIVKGPKEDGEIVQDVLFNSVPGLRELIDNVQSEWREKAGRILCIDGGYVVCPSASAALNYKIQSLGSIVMKLACILLYDKAKEENLWFRYLGNIHDEFQMETKKEDGERLGKLAVSAIEEAAVKLKFNLKLTGEFKLGENWDECH